MKVVGISVVSAVGCLALAVLLAWLTWSYVLGPVDRVFWASMFGFGSVGGQ